MVKCKRDILKFFLLNAIFTPKLYAKKYNKYDKIFDNIDEMKSSRGLKQGDVIYVKEYYTGYNKGGGVFIITNNENINDGGVYFITDDGRTIERKITNNIVKASDFGILPKDFDSQSKFSDFLMAPQDKIIDIDIYISEAATLRENTKLMVTNNSVIYAYKDISRDGNKYNQGQAIIVCSNCVIDGVTINGNGLRNCGFLIYNKKNVVIKNCSISNGKGQAILDICSEHCLYSNNNIENVQHGIQLWLSKNVVAIKNTISLVRGGIWTACAQNILVKENHISDCSDVGIDWEGGNNCISDTNTVKHCANGELAVFGTGKELKHKNIPMGNLIHKNNNIIRSGTFKNRSGVIKHTTENDVAACMLFGNLDEFLIGPIIFESNNINIESGSGTLSNWCFSSRGNNGSNANIIFKNNSFLSASQFGRLVNLNNVSFISNKFNYNLTSSKMKPILLKNIRNIEFISNQLNNKNKTDYSDGLLRIEGSRGRIRNIKDNMVGNFGQKAFIFYEPKESVEYHITGNK